MTGKQLFNKLTHRDFSGSAADEYASDLMGIFAGIGDDIFPLLEQAETEGKSLSVAGDDDEIMVSSIVLV